MSRAFDFGHLVELCRRTHEETRRSAVRAVDTYLAMRNWLFGWYIVEYEDGGADRSRLYGRRLIARLSDELAASGLKGCSSANLRKFREFYRAYPEIRQTLSVTSGSPMSNGHASQYQIYLPSKQELKEQLESVQKEPSGPRESTNDE